MPNARAQRLADEIRARRFMGQRLRRRKRLPKQLPPKGVERDYTRALFDLVERMRQELQPLLDELPTLTRSASFERERFDAGEGRRVRELIALARERLSASFNVRVLERLAEQFASATASHQRAQMGKQVRAALGIDILTSDEGLIAAAEAFTAENVALITNMPARTLNEIEGVVHRSLQRGALHKDLAAELEERFRIAKGRARLIARDQIGKYYGNVNRIRQQNMGVERYVWRTVNDIRVRPEHAARDGDVFSWDNPPSDGHPGEPIQCRCYPEPIFDL